MEWIDEGLVLSARPHGETAAVATLLTPTQGLHAGLVPGGQGRRLRPTLQPGTLVRARWRARLADHLGSFSLEATGPSAALWLGDPEVLAIIAAACALTEASLPERHPMPQVYTALTSLLAQEDRSLWGPSYVRWELGLLAALGYGLNLSCCALTGACEGLAYVSPRTGRAVTATAAQPYADKLLALPDFLCGRARWDEADLLKGLELTGHFLARHVFANPQNRRLVPLDGMLPAARSRLEAFYRQKIEARSKVA